MPPADYANTPDHLGATFARLRRQAGVRQDVLAAAIGVSNAHLSHFEAGRRNLKRETYERLVQALADEGDRQRREAGAA